jgi:hypothetical protein
MKRKIAFILSALVTGLGLTLTVANPASAASALPPGSHTHMVFQSSYTSKFVSVNLSGGGGSALQARADAAGDWEQFDLYPVPAADPTYAIWSEAASRWVTVNLSGAGHAALQATATAHNSWELFQFRFDSGYLGLYSVGANKFVSVNLSGGGNAALQATADHVGTWEVFNYNWSTPPAVSAATSPR